MTLRSGLWILVLESQDLPTELSPCGPHGQQSHRWTARWRSMQDLLRQCSLDAIAIAFVSEIRLICWWNKYNIIYQYFIIPLRIVGHGVLTWFDKPCDRWPQDIDVVLYPCGHFMLCRWCAQMVSDCPVCRLVITDVIRTYKVGICKDHEPRELYLPVMTVQGHDSVTADDMWWLPTWLIHVVIVPMILLAYSCHCCHWFPCHHCEHCSNISCSLWASWIRRDWQSRGDLSCYGWCQSTRKTMGETEQDPNRTTQKVEGTQWR